MACRGPWPTRLAHTTISGMHGASCYWRVRCIPLPTLTILSWTGVVDGRSTRVLASLGGGDSRPRLYGGRRCTLCMPRCHTRHPSPAQYCSGCACPQGKCSPHVTATGCDGCCVAVPRPSTSCSATPRRVCGAVAAPAAWRAGIEVVATLECRLYAASSRRRPCRRPLVAASAGLGRA